MPWQLRVAARAVKELHRLPPRDREAIDRALGRLVPDPGSVDIRKLEGTERTWRLRVGTWRVIFELDNAAGVVLVTRVVPRGSAYRD